MRLCGSYDQAGSLGYNLREEERLRRLREPDGVLRWVERGTAYRFEHDPEAGPPTLVALAARGLSLVEDRTKGYWMGRLAQIDDEVERDMVERVPGMSDPARSFALEVLRTNRGRLLRDCR
jgi:hypothetical protein